MSRSLRIAVFVETFPQPSETAILNQVADLAAVGNHISVYTRGSRGALPEWWNEFTQGRVTIHYFPLRPLGDEGSKLQRRATLLRAGVAEALANLVSAPRMVMRSLNWRRYGRRATRFDLLFHALPFVRNKGAFDIIHAQFGPMGIVAVLLREIGALEGMVVTTFRGYDINRLPRKNTPDYYDPLFKSGALFLTDTSAMGRKLAQLGCPAERIEVLHSAFFPERFPIRDRFNLEGPIQILSASRLVEAKGIDFALDAMRMMATRQVGFEFHYTIAGDGPLKDMLQRRASELGLNNVTFTGWQDQSALSALYRSADIFLMPSVVSDEGDEESQGLALQEAQATGALVVASDVGGISEGLLDGTTGFLVPQKDPSAICDAVTRLVSLRSHWPSMGAQARAFVVSEFSQRAMTCRLTALFERVLA